MNKFILILGILLMPVVIFCQSEDARFNGGHVAMEQYIRSNVRYPQKAIEEKIQGTVTVRFVVEVDGSISNISVRSKESILDEEAIRLIKNMPKWIPGKNDGIPLRTIQTLPINFTL